MKQIAQSYFFPFAKLDKTSSLSFFVVLLPPFFPLELVLRFTIDNLSRAKPSLTAQKLNTEI